LTVVLLISTGLITQRLIRERLSVPSVLAFEASNTAIRTAAAARTGRISCIN